jgi:hypothetical protein
MNAAKAHKKDTTCFTGARAVPMVSESRLPNFPDNFFVVGSGDESGTYILVVVLAGRGLTD